MLKVICCQVCNKSMTETLGSGVKVTHSRYAIIGDDGSRTLACKSCFKKHYKREHEVRQLPFQKDGKNLEEWRNIPVMGLDGKIKDKGGEIQE